MRWEEFLVDFGYNTAEQAYRLMMAGLINPEDGFELIKLDKRRVVL